MRPATERIRPAARYSRKWLKSFVIVVWDTPARGLEGNNQSEQKENNVFYSYIESWKSF